MSTTDAFHVYDTTLRDGAQQEGLNLSVADKLNIARQLDGLGVGYIEGGWPGANPKDTEFFRRAREDVEELVPTGPLISAVTHGWDVASTSFGPDDMLLVCTDGVLEARDLDGREFGTDGLLSVVRGLDRWSADEAVAECREAVRRFAVDVRRDDVTCVALTLARRPQPV